MRAAEFGSLMTPTIRNAFIDFTLPMAPVHARIGYQYIDLPKYMGTVNPILSDIAPAVVVSADLGMLQPTVAYVRAGDSGDGSVLKDSNDIDAVAVMVPVDMDMFTVTPWAAFVTTDGTTVSATASKPNPDTTINSITSAYWLGATSKINLIENATFGVDFLYQGTNVKNSDKNQTGFLLDAYASYSLDMATIGAAFWYASGADNKNETYLSSINFGTAGSWGIFNGTGALWYDQGPATWGGARNAGGPFGTMGLALTVSDVNVIDNLNLGAHIMYLTSTSDTNSKYGSMVLDDENNPTTGYTLGDDSSAIEVGASAAYAIYDDLTASVNAYYTIPMDILAQEDSAFTGGVTLKYAF